MKTLTNEELQKAKRLIAAAGLIKVYDGRQWVDLRDVMTHVVDFAAHMLTLHEKMEAEQAQCAAEAQSDGDAVS